MRAGQGLAEGLAEEAGFCRGGYMRAGPGDGGIAQQEKRLACEGGDEETVIWRSLG